MNHKIRKILIANRAEIAVRIIRAARESGIRTVAVFSDADREMPHVTLAHEAYYLGDPEPASSYLHMDKIISIAKESHCDAIHPGYGFLSENPEFASKVAKAGIIFIGPSPEAIRNMGNKLYARKMAKDIGIPVIPGSINPVKSYKELEKIASEIGYPVLLKASAGGGGKGMRVVDRKEELQDSLERAQSEAMEAFGNDDIYVEKYIQGPHHIEIQVLADQYGHVVHLLERECSIQRRHQKLVEESPSPFIDDHTRTKLTESAIKISKNCQYTGAGTVEFIVDDHMNFYFLEMNTRLQVEHPVTEEITGIDIVKQQFSIAAGNPLNILQSDIKATGHAIELRICAEDPENDFLPMNGRLDLYRAPKGPGIRVDDGYERGLSVSYYYDSLIGKLIAVGHSREEALHKLELAINEFQIGPLPTTLSFGKRLLQVKDFLNGNYNTHFLSENGFQNKQDNDPADSELAAISAYLLYKNAGTINGDPSKKNRTVNWKRNRNQFS